MPGLLSYREDNKKLYVNKGNKWDAIGSEKEVGKSCNFSECTKKCILGRDAWGITKTYNTKTLYQDIWGEMLPPKCSYYQIRWQFRIWGKPPPSYSPCKMLLPTASVFRMKSNVAANWLRLLIKKER